MNARACWPRPAGLVLLAALPLAAFDVLGDEPQRVAHGSADAYAERGAALAWAVQRGASEAATLVVIRIATDPARYPVVAVTSVDPFTQARDAALAPTRSAGSLDVRLPRARFGDFPRTEVAFHSRAPAAAGDPPALLVYYVGVPDTTPEFADAGKLEAYLAARVAKLRADPAGKQP